MKSRDYFVILLAGIAGMFAGMSNDPHMALSLIAIVFWHKLA